MNVGSSGSLDWVLLELNYYFKFKNDKSLLLKKRQLLYKNYIFIL